MARRYATALADVAITKGLEKVVQDELIGWELMISSNADLQAVLANPTVGYEQKRKVLDELIARTKVNQLTGNFLQILLKNQRLAALEEINKKFAEVIDVRAGVVAAHVTTARPVSESTKDNLKAQLAKFTGKDMRLSFSVDDSLIGGVVTRIGSTVYDGSIKAQLNSLEKVLAGQESA